ncbi:MAG: hypothetical protein ACRDJ4_11860 [Actinomycetota bacterium]
MPRAGRHLAGEFARHSFGVVLEWDWAALPLPSWFGPERRLPTQLR